MICPECGNENPEGAKFCMKCGTRFVQICPKCEAGNPYQASYCEQCGTSLASDEARDSERRWLPAAIAFIATLVIVAAAGVVLVVGPRMGWWEVGGLIPGIASPTAEPTLSPAPTETYTALPVEPTEDAGEITVTLPPPLAGVEFPAQVVDYPADWPLDLRFPAAFTLVETSSGTLEGGAEGWGAKLRYPGQPQAAADELSSFFTAAGWQVAERVELDSGGLLLLVQRGEDDGSGAIVLDPDVDAPGTTKILLTVFP